MQRAAAGLLVFAGVLGVIQAGASDAQAMSLEAGVQATSSTRHDCVIIDTDFDIDDMMAIPTIIANRDVRAIVTTEGASRPGRGAGALRVLLRRGHVAQPPPVIVGAPSIAHHRHGDYQWLMPVRHAMARVNNWLHRAQSSPQSQIRAGETGAFAKRVVKAVDGCPRIDILSIAPFSSFTVYAPRISDRIHKVVMQGTPLPANPPPPNAPLSFNCAYDLPSCEAAFPLLSQLRARWEEVPSTADPPYVPTISMVRDLRRTGLPNALRLALQADQTTWRPGRLQPGSTCLLWDQTAALYLLHPKDFWRVGNYWAPALSPRNIRRAWVLAANR